MTLILPSHVGWRKLCATKVRSTTEPTVTARLQEGHSSCMIIERTHLRPHWPPLHKESQQTTRNVSHKYTSTAKMIHCWRPLQVTVRPILRDRCPVCNAGVLWPNGWMDQDATWYGGRPRPRGHRVRWGPSSPTERGTAPPHFRPTLL